MSARLLAACSLIALTAVTLPRPLLASEVSSRAERARGPRPATAPRTVDLPSDPVKRTWDFSKAFTQPLYNGRVLGDCGPALAEYQQRVAAMNDLVDRFVAGPQDPKKMKIDKPTVARTMTSLLRTVDTYEGEYFATGKRGGDALVPPLRDDLCRAQNAWYSVDSVRAYAAAARRVYPDVPEVSTTLAAAEGALSRMGPPSGMQALVEMNRSGSLANVTLPAPLSTNPEWQAGFKAAFGRMHPDQTYLKQSLYSADWYVVRNEITEVPKYRQIGTRIAARGRDGKCRLFKFDRYQSWQGGGFGGDRYEDAGTQEISCAAVGG